MSRLPLLPLVLALLAVAVSGCGGSDDDSDAAQISDVTMRFYEHMRDEDWDGACEALTRVAQRNLADWGTAHDVAGGCGGVVEEGVTALGDPSSADLDKLHVEDVEVDGIRATATVSANGTDAQMSYVRQDGTWLIGPDTFPATRKKPTATTTGGATTAAAPARELEVDSGFSRVDDRKTSWGVRVRNPESADAVGVEVRIELAGDGATETRTMALIPAKGTAWIGGETDTPHEVRALQVSARPGAWGDPGLAPMPAPVDGRVVNTSMNVAVEADVRNPLGVALDEDTPVYGVLLDRSGRIVGGISAYPQTPIAPETTGHVTLVGLGPIRQAAQARVSADAPAEYAERVRRSADEP